MPRDQQVLVYLGIRNSVIALDDRTGAILWRAKLRGSDFVAVSYDGEALYAANHGEIFKLDPRTGGVIWHNKLEGLGLGLITIASSRNPRGSSATDVVASKEKRNRDAAAGAQSG
jgi:outer membrane protein assembly factor BamB